MENKEGYLEFVHSESYKNQIDVWYRAYNISREKTELFYDFLKSLHDLLNETYLGPEFLKKEEDQRNHFTWCWDKTIENFNKEKINVKTLSNYSTLLRILMRRAFAVLISISWFSRT